MCAPIVAADKRRALDGFVAFFTDEGYVRQLAEDAARQATTVEARDQYLRMLAYLPHCEALRGEAVTVLRDAALGP